MAKGGNPVVFFVPTCIAETERILRAGKGKEGDPIVKVINASPYVSDASSKSEDTWLLAALHAKVEVVRSGRSWSGVRIAISSVHFDGSNLQYYHMKGMVKEQW